MAIVISAFIHVKAFLVLPRTLCQFAGTAAWLLPLIAAFVNVLVLLALASLLRDYSRRSLPDIAGSLGGKPAQFLFGFFYSGYFLIFYALQLRIFGEFVLSTFLPETPLGVVLISMVLLNLYLCYEGLENVSRTMMILFPFLLVIYLFALTSAAAIGTFDHLSPWLGYGLMHTLGAGLAVTSLYNQLFLYGFIAPLFRGQRQLHRSMMVALGFAAAVMIFSQIVFQMSFTIRAAQQMGFPLYQIARLVQFGTFFQRIDPLFIFIWLIIITIGLAMGIYTSALVLAQGIKAPDFRPYLFPLAVIALCIAYVPQRTVDATAINDRLAVWLQVPFYGALIALFIWNRLLHRLPGRKKAAPLRLSDNGSGTAFSGQKKIKLRNRRSH
ncbi:GerAB/ArcD/ProY family transporter [Heliophilum fasciatum]|uniref:GerAB/ArcD/ProY family transporter n=1 Tax=Heliophilum fasciatum TaxID=35700 RepID=UPI001404F3BE|nr:GerAB/ArcD/ProY family transporter [Heliophilum fasciatum]MCW2279343.1 spore germination protein (amino acid permease) [Heliophilum fasciatum]